MERIKVYKEEIKRLREFLKVGYIPKSAEKRIKMQIKHLQGAIKLIKGKVE